MTTYPVTLVYTDADFRLQFPYFASTVTYPQATLQRNFDTGTNYVSAYNYGFLNDAARQTALYMMTAHLTMLNDMLIANAGAPSQMVTRAKIDQIEVTLQPPPEKNQFQWWLNLTQFGQQLLALLQIKSAGGWAVGGLPERRGFRRVGGGFGGRCNF